MNSKVLQTFATSRKNPAGSAMVILCLATAYDFEQFLFPPRKGRAIQPLADTQVWPALRIAPSTAASISASSKTMKGALPQSSKLIRSDLVRALPHQQPANLGRPSEADLSHFRIGTELAADYVPFRRIDQIEMAFGKTGGPRQSEHGPAFRGICSAGLRMMTRATSKKPPERPPQHQWRPHRTNA